MLGGFPRGFILREVDTVDTRVFFAWRFPRGLIIREVDTVDTLVNCFGGFPRFR